VIAVAYASAPPSLDDTAPTGGADVVAPPSPRHGSTWPDHLVQHGVASDGPDEPQVLHDKPVIGTSLSRCRHPLARCYRINTSQRDRMSIDWLREFRDSDRRSLALSARKQGSLTRRGKGGRHGVSRRAEVWRFARTADRVPREAPKVLSVP